MIEGGGKQMIEIVFKLVGETHSNVLFGRALRTYLQANIRTLFQAKLHSSVSLRIWNPYRAKWKNLLQVAVSMWSWEDSWWTSKAFHFCPLFIFVILEPFPKESSVVSHIIKDLRLIKKLDQGALGMSDPLGPLQLALKPNSASSINRPLLNFYYCAHWSLIMGNTEAWKQLNWYSTNSDLTVPAEVICQEGGGYMPTRRRRLYAKTAEVICQLPIDTLRTQT